MGEDQESLRELDEQWFLDHSAVKDPHDAWVQWHKWMRSRRHTYWMQVRKILQVAGGVGRTAVDFYLSDVDWEQLSDHTLWILDSILDDLNVFHPPRRKPPDKARTRQEVRGTRRIALLCDLEHIPSPRFHIEVLRGLAQAGEPNNMSVSIHGVSPGHPRFHVAVSRVIRLERPEGIIWFRITPDDGALRLLNLGNRIPAVIVHGELKTYQIPVLGHVYPDQSALARDVEGWARALPACGGTRREVVVVAMPRESQGKLSLRNQRIDCVHAGLAAAGVMPRTVEVPDYSAGNAKEAIDASPNACGFVCLSDEIAVAVVQLLDAAGRPMRGRVIGFDDSPLAARHSIPSFSQSLEATGERVWRLFTNFFRRADPDSWPAFQPMPAPLRLVERR